MDSQPPSPEPRAAVMRPYKKLRRFLQSQQDSMATVPAEEQKTLDNGNYCGLPYADGKVAENRNNAGNGNRLMPAYLPKKLRGRSMDIGRGGSVSTSPSESPAESPLTDWNREDLGLQESTHSRSFCIYE